jgi:hypothetical protein
MQCLFFGFGARVLGSLSTCFLIPGISGLAPGSIQYCLLCFRASFPGSPDKVRGFMFFGVSKSSFDKREEDDEGERGFYVHQLRATKNMYGKRPVFKESKEVKIVDLAATHGS